MHPVLFEIPGPAPWATAAIVAVLLAIGAVLELREQRPEGSTLNPLRFAGVALLAIVLGLALSAALARWGPLPVRAWGTMLMLGFVAAMFWAIWDSRNDEEFSTDFIIDLTLAILIGAVIGARLLSVGLNWGYYGENLDQLMRVWAGGLSFHGGLFGGLIAGAALTWHRGISVRRTMDLFGPSIALGYAITRVGCFLNGCCYGSPTDSIFGVVFPHIANAGVPGINLHPAQLYASAASLAIFAILLLLRSRISTPGNLFGSYLLIYSASRYLIEEVRRSATGEIFVPMAPLTMGQAGSIAIAIVVAGLMAWNHARETSKSGE